MANRSRVLLLCGLAAVALAARPALGQNQHAHHQHASASASGSAQVDHPEPRPGVTGARVMQGSKVPQRARQAFNAARRVPHIFDGLYCHCDCHDRDGLRSLLECYENGMATSCGICQGEANLAFRLHRQGRTLEEIRDGVDEEYGP